MKYFNDLVIYKNKIIDNLENYNLGTKICAMVKANAYGLGIKSIVKIIDEKVNFYGVANCVEAISLRKLSKKSILICGKTHKNNIKKCIENNISLTVDCLEEINLINQVCLNKNLKAKLHIKLNTGMNRLGVQNIKEFKSMILQIPKMNSLILEGIFTHFASADCDEKYLNKQLKKFKKMIKLIKNESVIFHCANSYVANNKKYLFDMVRIGIGLYENSISLTSKIIKIQNVNANQFVGYAPKFYTQKKIRIAVVPLGYADGIMRNYSNKGKVIINNKYYNIIGSICMDMLFVQIDENVKLNDKVILIGKSENCEITENYLAKQCETIPYEILTNLNKGRFNKKIV